MRRVLIITSSYAPTMIADMQRTRQLSWELPKLGWEVEVLCPSKEYQHATSIDEDSGAFFPPNLCAHYVPEIWPGLFKAAGIGTIGWRALLPLWFFGQQILRQKQFDLIYISTAHFPLFLLGRIWKGQFGIPYILDIHDPFYSESPRPIWMRSRLKYRLTRFLFKKLEAQIAPAALGLIAVSPDYIAALRRRYELKKPEWLRTQRCDAIPFSALPADLVEASTGILQAPPIHGPPYRITYVGVGGPVMSKAFTLFSRSLSQLRAREPRLCDGLRVELFGTMLGWKPGDRKTLADIAAQWGIDDLVIEEPARVSYRRSIELLLRSDGCLIFGVDDVGYMPSKLFTYALSGKPLLATLHRDGTAFGHVVSNDQMGHALWFGRPEDMLADEAVKAMEAFLREVIARRTFDRQANLEPYLASAMARRHVNLFEACLSGGRRSHRPEIELGAAEQ
jgi:glycosyltransferase involved in cell wall biosynthesis